MKDNRDVNIVFEVRDFHEEAPELLHEQEDAEIALTEFRAWAQQGCYWFDYLEPGRVFMLNYSQLAKIAPLIQDEVEGLGDIERPQSDPRLEVIRIVAFAYQLGRLYIRLGTEPLARLPRKITRSSRKG